VHWHQDDEERFLNHDGYGLGVTYGGCNPPSAQLRGFHEERGEMAAEDAVAGSPLIQMAPGDTTVGSTPIGKSSR